MQFKCDEDYKAEYAKRFIAKMFDLMQYSVRDCQRIVNEINLVCNSINPTKNVRRCYYWYPILVALIIIVKHSDERIYKKWFYTEKEDYYGTQKIRYSESPLFEFFEDVAKTSVEPMFSYLRNPEQYDNVAEAFMIHFINSFCPIGVLDEDELVKELNINIDAVKQNSFSRLRYPSGINQAIKEVKMLRL